MRQRDFPDEAVDQITKNLLLITGLKMIRTTVRQLAARCLTFEDPSIFDQPHSTFVHFIVQQPSISQEYDKLEPHFGQRTDDSLIPVIPLEPLFLNILSSS